MTTEACQAGLETGQIIAHQCYDVCDLLLNNMEWETEVRIGYEMIIVEAG